MYTIHTCVIVSLNLTLPKAVKVEYYDNQRVHSLKYRLLFKLKAGKGVNNILCTFWRMVKVFFAICTSLIHRLFCIKDKPTCSALVCSLTFAISFRNTCSSFCNWLFSFRNWLISLLMTLKEDDITRSFCFLSRNCSSDVISYNQVNQVQFILVNKVWSHTWVDKLKC